MSTRESTRAALLTALAAMMSMSATSYAQDSEIKEVTVTGSRLRRDEFATAAPVQLVTREETVLAGLTSTTETLQSAAVTSGSAQINNAFGGFVTQGGPGANTVGLRGLGAGRTLVLLNGRRIAPAGARGQVGSVDLNVLPSAIVDRVEVLRDGASSIYGSDAISGVINVITLPKVEGLTLEGNLKGPLGSTGGGEQQRISGVFGWNNDRLSVKASADFYRRNELTLGDRPWTQCNQDYTFDPATGARTDYIDPRTGQPKCYPITFTGSNGVTINSIGTQNLTGVAGLGATGTTFNRWRPSSVVTTGLVGYEGVGGGATSNLNVRDVFDPRMLNRSLITPVDIKVGYAEAAFKLNALGDAELYGMVLANRRESSNTGYRQLSLDYRLGSPLIPANLSTSNFSAATALTGTARVGVRAFIGFGNDRGTQEVDYAIGGVGLRGDFFIDDWKYDAYFTVSKSDAEYVFESWLTDRLANSLNVVAAPVGTPSNLVRTAANNTAVTCAVNLTNPLAGCIPAPNLTPQVVGGQMPQDWIDYTFVDVLGKTILEEATWTFNIDGRLFDMPAGEARAALGAEYRTSRINDQPAIDSQNSNLYNLTSSAITKGDDTVQELYAELELPLLRDKPGAKDLTINLSGRYTDYDSYGADETYKASLQWKPVEWATLRSTFGTSYRAPAPFEQFLGATTGFLATSNDPCNNWDSLPAGTPRRANCASEGLPTGFQQTSGITVFSVGGAAQGLEAETSENLTVGLVLRPTLPDSWGELAIAADYYDIVIENGVAQVGANNLNNLCYDDPGFRSATGAGYCTYITRDSARRLFVSNSFTNVSTQGAEGIDYNVRYTRKLGPGRFRANLEIQTFKSQPLQLIPTSPSTDFNGTVNAPKTAADLELTYTWDKWRIRASTEYLSSTDSTDIRNSANSQFRYYTESYSQYHASLQYTNEKWEATVGLRNLTDEEPPLISAGFYNRVGNSPLYSGYDYYGRIAFMNLVLKL